MQPALPILLTLLFQANAAAQAWHLPDGPSLTGRTLAYDARRQRLVTFGEDGATWEFDGSWRRHLSSTPAPAPRLRRWREALERSSQLPQGCGMIQVHSHDHPANRS